MARVFISHTGADSAAAKRLADDLRGLGHEVWIDVDAVHAGDSIVSRINEGLAAADCLVLLEGERTGSNWVSVEWMSTLARKLNGERIRLIPARLSNTDGPPILADLRYADLRKDWKAGLLDIHHAIV